MLRREGGQNSWITVGELVPFGGGGGLGEYPVQRLPQRRGSGSNAMRPLCSGRLERGIDRFGKGRRGETAISSDNWGVKAGERVWRGGDLAEYEDFKCTGLMIFYFEEKCRCRGRLIVCM